MADTPGTSGPYGSGGDYFDCRKGSAPSPSPLSGHPRASVSVSENESRAGSGLVPGAGPDIHGTGIDARDKIKSSKHEHPLRQNESANVDAEEQMMSSGEGEVSRDVGATSSGNAGLGAGVDASVGAGVGAGVGDGVGTGLGSRHGWHGRTRGEVSLEGMEAHLER